MKNTEWEVEYDVDADDKDNSEVCGSMKSIPLCCRSHTAFNTLNYAEQPTFITRHEKFTQFSLETSSNEWTMPSLHLTDHHPNTTVTTLPPPF